LLSISRRESREKRPDRLENISEDAKSFGIKSFNKLIDIDVISIFRPIVKVFRIFQLELRIQVW